MQYGNSEREILTRLNENLNKKDDPVTHINDEELDEAGFELGGKVFKSAFGKYSMDGQPISAEDYNKASDEYHKGSNGSGNSGMPDYQGRSGVSKMSKDLTANGYSLSDYNFNDDGSEEFHFKKGKDTIKAVLDKDGKLNIIGNKPKFKKSEPKKDTKNNKIDFDKVDKDSNVFDFYDKMAPYTSQDKEDLFGSVEVYDHIVDTLGGDQENIRYVQDNNELGKEIKKMIDRSPDHTFDDGIGGTYLVYDLDNGRVVKDPWNGNLLFSDYTPKSEKITQQYKIPNPDDKCTITTTGDEETIFVHGNGAKASSKDIVNAVSYMYGQSIKQSEDDLKNGKLSNRQVQRALNYSQTKGLPNDQKQKLFNDLNKQNID